MVPGARPPFPLLLLLLLCLLLPCLNQSQHVIFSVVVVVLPRSSFCPTEITINPVWRDDESMVGIRRSKSVFRTWGVLRSIFPVRSWVIPSRRWRRVNRTRRLYFRRFSVQVRRCDDCRWCASRGWKKVSGEFRSSWNLKIDLFVTVIVNVRISFRRLWPLWCLKCWFERLTLIKLASSVAVLCSDLGFGVWRNGVVSFLLCQECWVSGSCNFGFVNLDRSGHGVNVLMVMT